MFPCLSSLLISVSSVFENARPFRATSVNDTGLVWGCSMPEVKKSLDSVPFMILNNIFLVCLGGEGTARFAGQAPAVPLHQRGGFPPVQARLNVQQFQAGGEPLSTVQCKEISIYVFPEKEFCAASVPFSTLMCLWAIYIYIPTISPPIFLQQNRQTDLWEYINRSQKHECRNWDCGGVPFLGIFVSNFWHCVFAVCSIHSWWLDLDVEFGSRSRSPKNMSIVEEIKQSIPWSREV